MSVLPSPLTSLIAHQPVVRREVRSSARGARRRRRRRRPLWRRRTGAPRPAPGHSVSPRRRPVADRSGRPSPLRSPTAASSPTAAKPSPMLARRVAARRRRRGAATGCRRASRVITSPTPSRSRSPALSTCAAERRSRLVSTGRRARWCRGCRGAPAGCPSRASRSEPAAAGELPPVSRSMPLRLATGPRAVRSDRPRAGQHEDVAGLGPAHEEVGAAVAVVVADSRRWSRSGPALRDRPRLPNAAPPVPAKSRSLPLRSRAIRSARPSPVTSPGPASRV